ISAINKSMVVHDVRFRGAKQESDRMDAQRSYQEMEDLYQQISEMGEVIKLLHIRLFVASPTIWRLERKVEKAITRLNSIGFKGEICLNKSYYEWLSVFLPHEQHIKFPNQRSGQGLSAIPLGSGVLYHFCELNDRTGSFLGT